MALALLIATLVIQTVSSHQYIPYCIQTCLTEVGSALCDTHAFSNMTSCLTKACLNPKATQDLIASLNVTFSPKIGHLCQNAYELSTSEDSSVTLPLHGICTNSPYEYKSYLLQGVSRKRAGLGCEIVTFPDKDCLGAAVSSDESTLKDGRCVFRGGRSARLTCRSELDAVRAYIQTYCGINVGDENELDTPSMSSKTIYPSSPPLHGPATRSPGTVTTSSIPFHWPFKSKSSSAKTTLSMPFTMSSIPFHWSHRPLSFSTGSSTAYTCTSAATNIVDAIASSNATVIHTTSMYSSTLASALASTSASASFPESFSASRNSDSNGDRTSCSGDPTNTTYTLPTAPTVDPTTSPLYAGLAVQFSSEGKSAVLIALFGAGFALFR